MAQAPCIAGQPHRPISPDDLSGMVVCQNCGEVLDAVSWESPSDAFHSGGVYVPVLTTGVPMCLKRQAVTLGSQSVKKARLGDRDAVTATSVGDETQSLASISHRDQITSNTVTIALNQPIAFKYEVMAEFIKARSLWTPEERAWRGHSHNPQHADIIGRELLGRKPAYRTKLIIAACAHSLRLRHGALSALARLAMIVDVPLNLLSRMYSFLRVALVWAHDVAMDPVMMIEPFLVPLLEPKSGTMPPISIPWLSASGVPSTTMSDMTRRVLDRAFIFQTYACGNVWLDSGRRSSGIVAAAILLAIESTFADSISLSPSSGLPSKRITRGGITKSEIESATIAIDLASTASGLTLSKLPKASTIVRRVKELRDALIEYSQVELGAKTTRVCQSWRILGFVADHMLARMRARGEAANSIMARATMEEDSDDEGNDEGTQAAMAPQAPTVAAELANQAMRFQTRVFAVEQDRKMPGKAFFQAVHQAQSAKTAGKLPAVAPVPTQHFNAPGPPSFVSSAAEWCERKELVRHAKLLLLSAESLETDGCEQGGEIITLLCQLFRLGVPESELTSPDMSVELMRSRLFSMTRPSDDVLLQVDEYIGR